MDLTSRSVKFLSANRASHNSSHNFARDFVGGQVTLWDDQTMMKSLKFPWIRGLAVSHIIPRHSNVDVLGGPSLRHPPHLAPLIAQCSSRTRFGSVDNFVPSITSLPPRFCRALRATTLPDLRSTERQRIQRSPLLDTAGSWFISARSDLCYELTAIEVSPLDTCNRSSIPVGQSADELPSLIGHPNIREARWTVDENGYGPL
ncbi:hypothetical protein QF000_006674 [Paraburkholderia atlantica]